MSGRIPEDFIESLLERTDIVEVVGARVDLRPAGRGEHKALCPFHDEKTPSFTVSSEKQFYHCFGCGAHGTAIGFVMSYDGLEFPAAIEELAHLAGMEVPRDARAAPARRHDRLYEVLSAAQQWFRQQLGASDPARSYLKQRGFDKATVDEFGIGFAPESWRGLADHLRHGGFSPQEMAEAGLVHLSEKGPTDKFRGRVMFPIHDRRGRVIAFGGRVIGEGQPKYMNSPETPVFHKGRELYRLFQVRRGGLPDRILVVEGYMDAAALHQFGFHDTVATLGTAVTPEHLEALFRATPLVVFCFDGDRAGRQAAWRGLEAALPLMKDNRELRFLFLPEGEDPDTLVRDKGADALDQAIAEARPLSAFLIESLSRKLDLGSLDGRTRLWALAEPLIAQVPSEVFRASINQKLRQITGADSSLIRRAAPSVGPNRSISHDRPLTPVQYAIALIVQRPELAADPAVSVMDMAGQLKGLEFLHELIDFCRQRPHLSTAKLLELWRDRPETPWLSQLATREVCSEKEEMPAALAQTMARIRRLQVQVRVRELQQAQLNQGGLDPAGTAELRELLSLRFDDRDN